MRVCVIVCCLLRQVLAHENIRRAKESIRKRGNFTQRKRMWLQLKQLELIVAWCSRHPGYERFGVLFLLTYAFLLRLPSEALPMAAGRDSGQASLFLEGDVAVLTLARRKNKPAGSRMSRACWCRQSPTTCPVHAARPLLARHVHGQPFFQGISAGEALRVLRRILQAVGVAEYIEYRTHDLRRGHALDLQLSGAPLKKILEYGQWTSPAFLVYLDMHRLEMEAVVQAHVEESDSEAEEC